MSAWVDEYMGVCVWDKESIVVQFQRARNERKYGSSNREIVLHFKLASFLMN